jgi:hypothetical protein
MKTLGKRLTLLLLVLLTVFRGVVGDAMAIEMGTHAPSTLGAESSQSQTLSAAKPPCHGQDDSAQTETAEPTKCTACQVCHMATFVPSVAEPQLAAFTGEPPLEFVTPWHSADRAASFKPPVL